MNKLTVIIDKGRNPYHENSRKRKVSIIPEVLPQFAFSTEHQDEACECSVSYWDRRPYDGLYRGEDAPGIEGFGQGQRP